MLRWKCCATHMVASPLLEPRKARIIIKPMINSLAFSFNIIQDLQTMLQYDFMLHAFEAGTVVAVVAGIIGYFVVLRRSSFAAHALSHAGFTGAAGAVLIGINPLIGLLTF